MQAQPRPHLAAVLALLQGCNLPTRDIHPDTLPHFWSLGPADQPDGIIGLEVHGGQGLLRSLAVRPECRNQGLARQLLATVTAQAQTLGLTELYLLTTTAPDYFTRQGFAPVAREAVPQSIRQCSEFTSVCPKSAIVMRLALESA